MLVRDTTGTQLGSGVLAGTAPGGYWVVTNRHVVLEQKAVCVVTADHRGTTAVVISATPAERRSEVDLALLWLPRRSKDSLMVAVMAQKPVDAASLPLVTATGYPTPLKTSPDGPTYTERAGLLVPLLAKPLQGGFELAYTAAVEKGMSGGGVFAGGKLIGINGAHANPLWPGQWKDQQDEAVNEQLNDKLELVSLGIAWPTIQSALKAVQPPMVAQLSVLVGAKCNSPKPEAIDGRSNSKV
ncbi:MULTISPECIES: serine protease [unclassified Synechococcus]|uniref:S1 family peptidase n=1 Tax=unclassified Synechococcus TaxID=2626047 RepID=UPI0020CF24E2|nr:MULTISPECIES: serine protease [unclassified Synechococcus]MCP9856307.1 trypsin-like peptidase domain-containing protein [Synechococcus sp. Cruz-9C9]